MIESDEQEIERITCTGHTASMVTDRGYYVEVKMKNPGYGPEIPGFWDFMPHFTVMLYQEKPLGQGCNGMV